MRRFRDMRHVLALSCAAAAVLALVLAAPLRAAGDAEEAQTWRTAFERRAEMHAARRMIVILAAPSLADRAARSGGLPSAKAQRRFVRQAQSLQRRFVASLRRQGLTIRRERSYTLTFNGFSAVLDARALAVLGQAPGIVGVYPVRAVYPASVTAEQLSAGGLPAATAPREADGSGVTVALLDTAVDFGHPALAGHLRPGFNLAGAGSFAASAGETHGTRMAGIVAAAAPGADILPIRVQGKNGGGSDVLLAGLERAVDPDGDGDVEDATTIALAPVVEPYAAFADGPEALAVAGALELGTLVVAAAGNDGPAGAGFGTVGAPASAAAALAVGAADLRADLPATAVTVRAGDEILFDGVTRVLGPIRPDQSLTGGAVLIPADGTPLGPKVRAAKAAGAAVVLVYGSTLPAGALELDESTAIPVVAIPAEVGRPLLAGGRPLTVEFGPATTLPNPEAGRVAPFSSNGPVFDGRVKPDVVAAGVGILTADAGVAGDGAPRYATITGSSAAAATAAGAAAIVAQLRPELDASQLRAALVGSARPLAPGGLAEAVPVQGAGLVDSAAASAAELLVEPAALGFGRARTDAWSGAQTLRLTNSGDRPLKVHFEVVREGGTGAAIVFSAEPAETDLAPGASTEVRIGVSAGNRPTRPSVVSGWLVAVAEGAAPARLPWTIVFPPAKPPRLVGNVELSRTSFAPSARQPAVLSFRAGSVSAAAEGVAIEPVAVLDVELWRAGGERLGVLLRLRDLLPGRYAIGLSGRDALGRLLTPGRYVVKLRASSVDLAEGRHASTTVAAVRFRLEPSG
jgi:subtilisin family serine protease